jgi:hypothetical protein
MEITITKDTCKLLKNPNNLEVEILEDTCEKIVDIHELMENTKNEKNETEMIKLSKDSILDTNMIENILITDIMVLKRNCQQYVPGLGRFEGTVTYTMRRSTYEVIKTVTCYDKLIV